MHKIHIGPVPATLSCSVATDKVVDTVCLRDETLVFM